MKYLILVLLLLTSSCSSRTEFGKCVGLNQEKDQTLIYDLSTKNLVISVLFIETLFVPIVYALKQVYCPVGRKVINKENK